MPSLKQQQLKRYHKKSFRQRFVPNSNLYNTLERNNINHYVLNVGFFNTIRYSLFSLLNLQCIIVYQYLKYFTQKKLKKST